MHCLKTRLRLGAGLMAAAAAFSIAAPAHAADLVSNGGFEAGSLGSWSGTALASPYTGVYCPGAGSTPEGACLAFLGTDGEAATLSQVLATTVGQAYLVSFSFQTDGSTPSSFLASFGNQAVYTSVSSTDTSWQTVSFTAVASSTSTALVFNFRNDPGYFMLDNISVTAVPEPQSAALAAAGVLGLMGAVARRRLAGRREGAGKASR